MTGRVADRRPPVGQFLQEHPEFTFDIEEYLLATQCVGGLEKRHADFQRSMQGEAEHWPARRLIVDAVQQGACEWVAAYQSYRDAPDITNWPFTDKSAVRAAPEDFVSVDLPRSSLFLKTTTGSSGAPIPIWHSAECYFDGLMLAIPKIAWFLGARDAGARSMFCISLSDDRAKQEFITADPTGRSGVSVRMIVDEKRLETYDRALIAITDLSPACISSKPCILESLAVRAETVPGILGNGPSFIISSGAKLEAGLRARLESAFGCQAVEAYGMTELGVIAYPCSRGSLHIDGSLMFLEIVDTAGNVLPEGQQGEIVVSSLSNRAMPLLRYRTGDLGALDLSKCGCGSPAPRLTQLSGRIIRCLRLPSGRLFAPTYFNDLFVRFDWLAEFQITQTSRDAIEVLLQPRPGAEGAAGDLNREVEAYVRNSLPEPLTICAKTAYFGKDSKFQRFRSCL
jgi:phenylacetate-CoA ligase